MTGFKRFIHIAFFTAASCFACSNSDAQSTYVSEYIFPLQELHVHSSSLVELPNGDLLVCWFEGSGERTANDVVVKGARLKKGSTQWSQAFIMANTPGHPDCNPSLFIDDENTLHLFWIVVQANRWETSILKTRSSSDYEKKGAPQWDWQDIILLKPGEEFISSIEKGFIEQETPGLAWAEYAPLYERMIVEAARDPKKRETGWMTRCHPIQLKGGRILLPLYSDGYNLSLIAISDNRGQSWKPGLPIVGRGNIQPSLVQKKNGDILAFMRDNGDYPGRVMKSISTDNGYSWSSTQKSSLPNPGTSVEAIFLQSGNCVLVYNDLEDGRHSLAISLSEDEGETWPWTRHLEQREPEEGSFSYPSVIQTRDAHIHVSYSFHIAGKKTIKHRAFSEEWIKNK